MTKRCEVQLVWCLSLVAKMMFCYCVGHKQCADTSSSPIQFGSWGWGAESQSSFISSTQFSPAFNLPWCETFDSICVIRLCYLIPARATDFSIGDIIAHGDSSKATRSCKPNYCQVWTSSSSAEFQCREPSFGIGRLTSDLLPLFVEVFQELSDGNVHGISPVTY